MKALVKVLHKGMRLGTQRVVRGGAGGGGLLVLPRALGYGGGGCGTPAGARVQRRVLGAGFRAWHVVHHPVRAAFLVRGGFVADACEIPRGQMGFVDFVHLLFDVGGIGVPLLGGESAVLGVQQLGMGMTVLEGGEELIAEDFVAALGGRREGGEVGVVQGPGGSVREHLPIRLIEDEVDGVSGGPVGQPFACEDDAVAREAGF